MIKIEKIEKGYLRCQSCNDDSPLDNISIGLNLNNTSSFRLCCECLSIFSKTIDKVKIEKLQEQNKILREALGKISTDTVDVGLYVEPTWSAQIAREALAKIDKQGEG